MLKLRGEEFCATMLLYLTQIKAVSHDTWAIGSGESLQFLPTKFRFSTFLVVSHFTLAYREYSFGIARFGVELPVSRSHVNCLA